MCQGNHCLRSDVERAGGGRGRSSKGYIRNSKQPRGCRTERRAGFNASECDHAVDMACGGDCCVSTLCVQHLRVGRGDVPGSGQSGKLVAFSCRGTVLSGFSDDLVTAALASFMASHGGRTAPDMEFGRRVDCRNDISGSALPAASCWNQRMAAVCSAEPGFRHHDRERRAPGSPPPLYFSGSSVSSRA